MKRVLLAVFTGLALFQQGSSMLQAQASTPPLNFFKNYFLTGDYAVQGIGLRGAGQDGFATGDIVVPQCAEGDTERLGCVPRGVDVVAAFLYWQAIASAQDPSAGAKGVRFKGQPLSQVTDGVERVFGKDLSYGTPPCWSSGGGTGGGSGQNNLTSTFRVDVLRFLTQDPDTGKTAGYGSHQIRLRDDKDVAAVGASLVIVYRDSSLPYSAIVMYDGTYSMAQGTPDMTLRVGGFYEADDADTSGKITHIVGSGQDNKQEVVFYNDTTWVNPFIGSAGRSWDNPTFPVQVSPALRTITTGARPDGNGSFDCLTWAAVVYRTPVNDDDEDGLLNLWETSPTPVVDPYGRELPLLSKMGADPNVKDVFIEVNSLQTGTETSYGTGAAQVTAGAHSHRPAPEAIRLFGDMFKARGVNVHFDLGAGYDVGGETGAEPYVIRDVVPGLTRGGESFDESITVCHPADANAPPWVCQFSAYPGTVGWKTGLRGLRDAIKSQPAGLDCSIPANTGTAPDQCQLNFDPTRLDIFRYALFAHAIGLPKSTRPCLDGSLNPIEDVGGQCPAGATANPDFRVPRTYSGVADFPGGDLIVSLGGFKDAFGLPVGTPFMQASTLAHEFGHTGERRHGGEPFEPNCKPGYLSVMNYLYQLRGLLDDAGTPHLDFSDGTPFTDVDESAVQEGVFSTSNFRLGWYAPLDFSYLKDRRPPTRSRCDGTALRDGERMVRIDARRSTDPIDWNANDTIEDGTFAQDVNFNGRVNGTGPDATTGPLKGFSDDWSNLKLNQVGSRRNVAGFYRLANGTLAAGPMSLAVGKVDLGEADLGKVDLEAGKVDLDAGKVDLDLGKVDLSLGKVDLDSGKVDLDTGKVDLDLGAAEEGSGDIGRGDLGGGDLFTNDPDNPLGELDATTAAELARTPPNTFAACLAGANCSAAEATLNDVIASWTMPTIGDLAGFTLYRVEGATLKPGQDWTPVVHVPAASGQEAYQAIDGTELTDGAKYTYFAMATYVDGIQSDPSNLVTVTAVNLPAAAADDAYTTSEDTPLTVPAAGVLANDGDPDSPVVLGAQLVNGPAKGTLLLNADGSFTYTPSADVSGTDAFTYRAVSGAITTNTATVTITIAAVNDGPSLSPIADQAIDQDTSTGPLAFTVSDDASAGDVTLAGSSSNTVLVPNTGIVFGGSGASRTVTVTPAAGKFGSAQITVTANDGGLTTSISFTLTVRQAAPTPIYGFVALRNLPPPDPVKAGSSVPMLWQYAQGTTVVDSRGLHFLVSVTGPNGSTEISSNTDAGSSYFRYQASSRQWTFNLQTKDGSGRPFPVGRYRITITVIGDGRYAPGGPFDLTLVK